MVANKRSVLPRLHWAIVGASGGISHPDFTDLNPDLNTKAVAIVGNGNVAIDIARVLVKTPAEMATTDLAEHAAKAIHASPLTDVYMFGRRGPVEAKFTNVELREMGELEQAAPVVDANQIPDEVTGDYSERDLRLRERNIETMRKFVPLDDGSKPMRVHFAFFSNPVEVLGGSHVEGLRLEKTQVEDGRAVGSGEFFEIECGLVLPAIGYRAEPMSGLPIDERVGVVTNNDGHVEDNLYVAGWIKRGPTGTIGTNKHDGDHIAKLIAASITPDGKPGRDRLTEILGQRGAQFVDFDGWKKIDAAEIAGAPEGAPRRKFATIEEMLACLN